MNLEDLLNQAIDSTLSKHPKKGTKTEHLPISKPKTMIDLRFEDIKIRIPSGFNNERKLCKVNYLMPTSLENIFTMGVTFCDQYPYDEMSKVIKVRLEIQRVDTD